MKGKIDNRGSLYIERGGVIKRQFCPYAGIPDNVDCGDWCPLFGEPEESIDNKLFYLDICRETLLVFDSFTDERPRP
jgi:hypothetical protein